jgi:hypothetical protein
MTGSVNCDLVSKGSPPEAESHRADLKCEIFEEEENKAIVKY